MDSLYRLSSDKGLCESDIKPGDKAVKEDQKWDQRLGLILRFFSTASQKGHEPHETYYNKILEIIRS